MIRTIIAAFAVAAVAMLPGAPAAHADGWTCTTMADGTTKCFGNNGGFIQGGTECSNSPYAAGSCDTGINGYPGNGYGYSGNGY